MNLNFKNMQKAILCLLIATGAMAKDHDHDHPFSPGVKYKPTLVISAPTTPSNNNSFSQSITQVQPNSSPATARGSGAPVPRPCSPLNLSASPSLQGVSDLTVLTITPPPSEPPSARAAIPASSSLPTPDGGSSAPTSRLSPRGAGLPPRAPVTAATGSFLFPPTASHQPLSSLQKNVDEALIRRHLLEVLEKSTKECNAMQQELNQLTSKNTALATTVATLITQFDRHTMDPHTHLIETRYGQLTKQIELLEDDIRELKAQTAKCHCTIL